MNFSRGVELEVTNRVEPWGLAELKFLNSVGNRMQPIKRAHPDGDKTSTNTQRVDAVAASLEKYTEIERVAAVALRRKKNREENPARILFQSSEACRIHQGLLLQSLFQKLRT